MSSFPFVSQVNAITWFTMFRRVLIRAFLGLLIAAGVGGTVFFGTVVFGRVAGEEFCPHTFERRHYWYYELPLVRWKITPVFRDVQATQLEQLLVRKKYVIPKLGSERWDLVFARRTAKLWRQGDAQILCQYLDAYDHENNLDSYWETWTTDHPKLAKVLWPEVASLAQKNHYFLIPQLFEATPLYEKPDPMREHFDQMLAHDHYILAKTEAELGQLNAAVDLYSEALRYQDDHWESLNGRAVCYEQLGEDAKAAEDRNAAAHLPQQKAEKEQP